ncbi:hypothetical protein FTV88_2161 [Heliorestis convoluta]|uniref:Uncharacterized protein n=1 Tax=Heliorestis convoluta TaxID=356322 RepID=A0A5Q2N315_9FIRM|nr:hypothetical protein FTV88_2161 [Heliorestis convoluta]
MLHSRANKVVALFYAFILCIAFFLSSNHAPSSLFLDTASATQEAYEDR